MRLKWLGEILNTDLEAGDVISAFVTQLHVVALISTVFYHNRDIRLGYERPRKEVSPAYHLCIVQPMHWAYPEFQYPDSQAQLDFAFLPELLDETRIDFKGMQSTELRLLEGKDFSQDALVKALDRAIELGVQAQLHYTVRPVLSLQLRLSYLVRDFTKAATVCEKLDKAFKEIQMTGVTHTSNLAFMLVEVRQAGQTTRQVYCCPASPDALDNFVSTICTKERFGNLPVKACRAHVGSCVGDGVCVVQVVPLNDIPSDGEDPHCWREFGPNFTLNDVMDANPQARATNTFWVQTKNALPHYRMVTDVIQFGFQSVEFAELVRISAHQASIALDQVTGEFDVWFEMEENLVTRMAQLIGNEMPKYKRVLESTLDAAEAADKKPEGAKKSDSIHTRLDRLKTIDPISAKSIATDLFPHWDRLLMSLRRTCKEVPEMGTYQKDILPMYTEALKRLIATHGLDATISEAMTTGKPNLMNVKMDFEK
jgi:hypothetical protein